MHRISTLSAGLAGAALALFSAAAAAEAKLSYGRAGTPGQAMEIGKDAVRMSQHGERQWMLYRDSDRTLFIVDDGQRSYQRVDKKMMDGLQQQMQAMQKQLEAQMAMLPPEQRKMMQGMMPQAPDMSAADYSVEWGQGRRKVSGYSCRPLVVKDGDTPVEEMCLASVDELKLSPADLALLKRMGKTMGELAASFGAGGMAAVMEASDGIPVEHREPGADEAKSVLLKVERGAQPAERFAVPENYREKPLYPGMGQ